MNWQVFGVWVVVGVTAMAVVAPRIVAAQERIGGGDVVASGAELVKLADGFSFTEGPAVDSRGNVFFTDQPNDKILEWDAEKGELRTFLSPSGRANGLFFDREGNIVAAADEFNEIRRIAPDGTHEVVVRKFDDQEFNGPNDVWVHPRSGDIYFTDPLYARPYWTHRGAESLIDGEHVYRVSAKTGEVTRIAEADDLKKPNGIVGTANGKTLYIADIGDGKTWAFSVGRDGDLSKRRFFAPMGSDGMTIDERGNIYVTGRGVTVFNSRGEKIAHIDVPASWTANVVFGGADRKTLFITAMDALYSIRMNVAGVK